MSHFVEVCPHGYITSQCRCPSKDKAVRRTGRCSHPSHIEPGPYAAKVAKIRCPNCGEKVEYGSEHARGRGEFDLTWVCEKAVAKSSPEWPPPTISTWVNGGGVNVAVLAQELNEWAAYFGGGGQDDRPL